MNFQDLAKIENSQFYLDTAFRNAKKQGERIFPQTSGENDTRVKITEIEKIKAFRESIIEKLDSIIKKYPSLDNLPEFYNELVRSTLDYEMLKKSLGSLGWARENIMKLSKEHERKMRMSRKLSEIYKYTKEFYGRVSSYMAQIDKFLKYLEEARKIMRTYPTIKTDLYTVAITGFPNIGKSTLLSKITPAKPEIQDYSFTTKGLNQGYSTYGIHKVQFIDTPGVLNRDRMNNIEQQAYLVLKYLAHLIVYVIDLTEPYDIKVQEKLLKTLKDYDKPVLIYLSKTDILPADIVAKAKKKYKASISADELRKKIEKAMSEHYFS